jgi:hypothetical protein
MKFYTTREVVEMIGVPETRLRSWIRSKRLAPPKSNASLEYVWFPADVRRAQEVAKNMLGRKQEVT